MINFDPLSKRIQLQNIWKIVGLLTIFISCQPIEKELPVSLDLSKAKDSLEVLAPSFISTGLYERDIAISSDGKEIIFSRGDHKQSRRVLMRTVKTEQGWSDPEVLSFSGEHQDIEPFFSHQDQRVYFASDRPYSVKHIKKNYNIWYSDRNEDSWSAPVALDTLINTEGDEFYPSLSANGNLYFTASRKDGIGREDIFYSPMEEGNYNQVFCLDSMINTPVYEFNAYVNPDENLLIFSSYGRKDGSGGGDLYYSKKDSSGKWGPSQNLGPSVNSKNLDYCPFYDPVHEILYLSSDRITPPSNIWQGSADISAYSDRPGNGFGDIYWINWKPE